MILLNETSDARFSWEELQNYECTRGRHIEFKHLEAFLDATRENVPEVMQSEDARWMREHLTNGCNLCSDALIDLYLYKKGQVAEGEAV